MTAFPTEPDAIRARLEAAGWTAKWFKERGLVIGGRDPGLLRGAATRGGWEGMFEIVPACEDGDAVDRVCTRAGFAQATRRLGTSKAWAWAVDHDRARDELAHLPDAKTVAELAAHLRGRGWAIEPGAVIEDHEDGVWQIRGVRDADCLRYELLWRTGTPTVEIRAAAAGQALIAALAGG